MASALAAAPPMRVTSRVGRVVEFPGRVLLAPMEGVTDRTFRDAVIDLGGVGGACTEFVRISVGPIPTRVIRRSLGAPRRDGPVAVQLMTAGTEHLAETIHNAGRAGAAWVDLNFGCPVRRVCGKGAGSALLADPDLVAAIVAEAVAATELPVSAKIRAGVDDVALLGEVVDAVASAGAAMLTVHARRRVDGYDDPANWEWIATAVDRWRARSAGPLIGNGGVAGAADVERLRAAPGWASAARCVSRWGAGGAAAAPAAAAAWALRYLDAIQPDVAAHHRLGRFKQLVRHYRAGGIFDGREDARALLLRAPDCGTLRAWFGVSAPR